jgi:hypothetical protein
MGNSLLFSSKNGFFRKGYIRLQMQVSF